jgi:uncharacterized protein (TIGR02453 family)
MQYFAQDFIDFFDELKRNNNRDWFQINKKRYEQSVKIPFENFIQDMIFKIQEDDENLMTTPKESIFRIYRDIRFSNDKTPYKTHASAVIVNGGRKNYTEPGVYIEISSDKLNFYSGIYQMSKEQLWSVREYISSNLKDFENLINDKAFKKYFGKVEGKKNKRLPIEFRQILEKQPLIANKQFYYIGKVDIKKILSKNLTGHLMKYYYAAKPMNQFLSNALH